MKNRLLRAGLLAICGGLALASCVDDEERVVFMAENPYASEGSQQPSFSQSYTQKFSQEDIDKAKTENKIDEDIKAEDKQLSDYYATFKPTNKTTYDGSKWYGSVDLGISAEWAVCNVGTDAFDEKSEKAFLEFYDPKPYLTAYNEYCVTLDTLKKASDEGYDRLLQIYYGQSDTGRDGFPKTVSFQEYLEMGYGKGNDASARWFQYHELLEVLEEMDKVMDSVIDSLKANRESATKAYTAGLEKYLRYNYDFLYDQAINAVLQWGSTTFMTAELRPMEYYKDWDGYPTDISGNETYDAATALWGKANGWRTPTYAEMNELVSSCSKETITLRFSEIRGIAFKSTTSDSRMFLPFCTWKDKTRLSSAYPWQYMTSTQTGGTDAAKIPYIYAYGAIEKDVITLDQDLAPEIGQYYKAIYGYSLRPVRSK